MLSELKENGYAVVKGLFDPETLNKVRRDILQVFGNLMNKAFVTDQDIFNLFKNDFEGYINCAKICHNIISIHKLETDDRLLNLVKSAGVESPAIAMRPVLFMSSKHIAKNTFYWKAAPHQDFYAMRTSKDSLIVWVPICEITKALGYLEVVPKSHEKGLLNHVKDGHVFRVEETLDDSMFKSIEMNLGDALVFSSFLIHRSGTNVTDNIRWAINFRYCNLLEKEFVASKYPQCYDYVSKM